MKTSIITICLTLVALLPLLNAEEVKWGSWKVHYDNKGLSGLANPDDPYGADMITTGQHLRLVLRYRYNGGDWRENFAPILRSASNALIYTSSADNLKVTQRFQTNGDALDWTIELTPIGNLPVEIGDLGIQIPVPGPGVARILVAFTSAVFLRHQFVEGMAPFFTMCGPAASPPFLVVTLQPGTKLEYFSGAGRGDSTLFVHSALSGSSETNGTWRGANPIRCFISTKLRLTVSPSIGPSPTMKSARFYTTPAPSISASSRE